MGASLLVLAKSIYYSHYSGTKEKKKLRIQETIQNEMIEIISYVQFLNQCATCTAKVAKLSIWLLLIYK